MKCLVSKCGIGVTKSVECASPCEYLPKVKVLESVCFCFVRGVKVLERVGEWVCQAIFPLFVWIYYKLYHYLSVGGNSYKCATLGGIMPGSIR